MTRFNQTLAVKGAAFTLLWIAFSTLTMLPADAQQDDGQQADTQETANGQATEGAATAVSKDELEIRELFREFESASKDDTAERLMELFDFQLLVDAVIAESGVDLPAGLQNQLVVQVAAMTRRQYEAVGDRWVRHKIVQLRWTEDKSIAEVFVRNWCEEDYTTSRTVFYLQRTDRGLKIYDWMDLSLGFGTVSLTAAIMRDGYESNFPPQVAHGLRALFQSMMEMMQDQENFDRDWFDRTTGTSLPPMVEAIRWNLQAAASLESDPVYALECLDKLEAFNERVIMSSFMRANAHLQLGNSEKAVRYCQDYLNQFGSDADTFYMLGAALGQLDRMDEAIDAFKAGLQDTPEAIGLVEELALVLPADRKQEFVAAFKALPDPIAEFEYLADSFESYEDAEALSTLIETALTITKDLPHLDYYQIVLLIQGEEYGQAFEKLIAAVKSPATDPDYLTYYEDLLCSVAVKVDKVHAAYDACSDKLEAISSFEYQVELSDEIEERLEQLHAHNRLIDSLYAAYAEAHPDDAEVWSRIGGREMDAENYAEAVVHLKKAIELAADESDKQMLLDDCVTCYLLMDEVVKAYQDLDDKRLVFRILSFNLEEESDEFLAVKKLHRERFPYDVDLLLPEIEQSYESAEYAQVLTLADQAIAFDANQEDVNWRLDRVQFYRILALAHLKRTDEALIASRTRDDDERDHLRALVYAIKGQRQRFTEAYQRCLSQDPYFGSDDILAYIEVPADWMPERSDQAASAFIAYQELRRVVFLLPEPIAISSFFVRQAAQATGLRLFEVAKSELATGNNDYICEMNEHAVVLAADGCKYFLSVGKDRYDGGYIPGFVDDEYEDSVSEDSVSEEQAVDQERVALEKAVADHQAWFAIDLFTWPQELESEQTDSIPPSASLRLAELTGQMIGNNAVVAVHPDRGVAVICDDAFLDRFYGENPLSAFVPESAEPAE